MLLQYSTGPLVLVYSIKNKMNKQNEYQTLFEPIQQLFTYGD